MIKEENILGIIGHPIEHSISPAIHSIAINHWNLPLEYKKWDLEGGMVTKYEDSLNNLV